MSFELLSVLATAYFWGEGVAARRASPGTATAPLQRNPPRRLPARTLLGLALASASFAAAPGAWAYTRPVAPYAGELLVLRQTPHLLAFDAAGVAHLVPDLHIESLMLDGSLNGQVPIGQTAQESSERSAQTEVTTPAGLGPPRFRSEGEPPLPPPDRPVCRVEWAVA
jgi:hypothetical protein